MLDECITKHTRNESTGKKLVKWRRINEYLLIAQLHDHCVHNIERQCTESCLTDTLQSIKTKPDRPSKAGIPVAVFLVE